MKKELKDYLHLYLGCGIDTGEWFAKFEITTERILESVSIERGVSRIAFYYPDKEKCERSESWELPTKSIKPILRPLSDMTEEEQYEFQTLCELEKEDLSCIKLEKSFFNDYMQFGTAHLTNIIQWSNGVHFLLSKHFDLFQLIEAGLAIDKTTLK